MKVFYFIILLLIIGCTKQSENIISAELINIEKNHEFNNIIFDIAIETKKETNANIVVWCQDKNYNPESRFVWTNYPIPNGLLSGRKQLQTSSISKIKPFELKKGKNLIPAAIGNLSTNELRLVVVEFGNIVFDEKYFLK